MAYVPSCLACLIGEQFYSVLIKGVVAKHVSVLLSYPETCMFFCFSLWITKGETGFEQNEAKQLISFNLGVNKHF